MYTYIYIYVSADIRPSRSGLGRRSRLWSLRIFQAGESGEVLDWWELCFACGKAGDDSDNQDANDNDYFDNIHIDIYIFDDDDDDDDNN